MSEPNLRIGISSCLLGDEVRYDGGHKRSSAVMKVFAEDVEWVKVCPEVEVGMGTPREPVRLVGKDDQIRMLGTRSGTDWTEPMRAYTSDRVEQLTHEGLDAYILKSRSPSCGLTDGLFARGVRDAFPLMPVAEESALEDPWQMDGFVERVFAYRRLRGFFEHPRSVGQLVLFHSQSRMQLDLHDPGASDRLSHLVVNPKSHPWEERASGYQRGFTAALANEASLERHVLALSKALQALPDVPRDLERAFRDFRAGYDVVVHPLSLLASAVDLMQPPLLYFQTYATPSPEEMVLRNRVWL